MFKNVSGQKLTVFAFDSTTGLPKTGDAANITAYVSKDGGTVTALGDTSATEYDSTNAKGYYDFDLAQAETNCDKAHFTAKSSTANIVVIAVPAVVYTLPANFTSFSIDSSGLVSLTATQLRSLTRYKQVTWINTTDTAKTVIEAASAGTLCILAPGTHTLGNNQLTVPDGVSVWGCGRDVTTMTTTYLSATNQIFKPGSNSEIADFTFQTTNASPGSTYDFCFGATSGSFTNAVARRMRFISHTDGLYISTSSVCTLTLDDVIFESDWDTCVLSGAAHIVTLKNVVFAPTESNLFHQIDGIVNTNGKMIGSDVHIRCRVGGSTTNVNGINASNSAEIYFENSSVSINGAATTLNSITANTPCTFVNCEFDRSKASGTFRDVVSPLQPTTWGRKLDVSTGGEAGLDWANIGSPTTSLNLSATTISSSQVAASVTGSIGSIGSGGITTASIASSALNGKGDWFTFAQYQAPDNDGIAAAAASASTAASAATSALGQATTAASSAASADTKAAAIKAKTDNLPASPAATSDVPTATQNANAVAAQSSIATALTKIATNLDAKVSEVSGGGIAAIPVNQVPVPASRTWVLKQTDNGLASELPIVRQHGETDQIFAIDWRNDLATNGRVVSIDSVAILSGPGSGITLSNADGATGVDRSQTKHTITLTTAGTYLLQVAATYDHGDGIATVTLIVT